MKFWSGWFVICGAALLAGCATEPTYPEPDPAVVQSCAETSDYDRNLAVKAANTLLADAKVHNAALGFALSEGVNDPATHIRPTVKQPPMVSFPRCATARGIEGRCEIYFNVLADGTPDQITPVCSHRAFAREAQRAVTKAVYAPATVDGTPVEYHGIIRPIRFELEDSYISASTDVDTE